MGTPVRLPREQRRAQLLAAAIDQFTAHGYHRASMESIAVAAGVTKPVLYQHFSSKEDLYLAVIRSIGDRLVAKIDELERSEGETRARISRGIREFVEFAISSGESLRLLENPSAVSDEVTAEISEIVEHSATAIASVLVKTRAISSVDAAMLGTGLAAMARDCAARIAADPDPAERERLVDMLTSFVARGLDTFEPLSPR